MSMQSLKRMLKTGPRGLFLFVAIFFLDDVCADVSGGMNDPKLLFEKMLQAKITQSYTGSIAYEEGRRLSTYEVESDASGFKVIRTLNGPTKSFEILPEDACNTERLNSAEDFAKWYNFSYSRSVRVAGRNGHEIALSPVGPDRLGYVFVVDQDTGLMLSKLSISIDRRILERSEFLTLNVLDPTSEDNSLNGAYPNGDQYLPAELSEAEGFEVGADVELDRDSLDRGSYGSPVTDTTGCEIDDSALWSLSWVPEGFKLLKQEGELERYTLLYGDGLSSFSLFIEQVNEVSFPAEIFKRGATMLGINYFSTGEAVFRTTFVGEVPEITAERVLRGLVRGL